MGSLRRRSYAAAARWRMSIGVMLLCSFPRGVRVAAAVRICTQPILLPLCSREARRLRPPVV